MKYTHLIGGLYLTDNFKLDLFILDLSFFFWYILVGITLGIASIYVEPYISCTKAMYYENLKHNALVNGLDDFPSADLKLREELMARLREEGVESLRLDLQKLDPESYATIDIANGQRVVRALEVCLMTGKPFSSFKTSPRKQRDFEVEKIGLMRPRDVLYDRINRRVVQMIDEGLVDEVRSLTQYRDLAALQTVGYKEIFDWFDGTVESLDRAVELIQRNTRHYAKRQLSYWGRDKDIRWMEI